jgi:hypothetical protein
VTARVQFVCETDKLLGARRNTVKEHDRDRADLAVEQELGAPCIRDTAVIAAPKSFEQGAGLIG